MPTKNKGEVSEFYAFVYILGNRVIELVDGHLQLLGQSVTFLRVFRNEGIVYQFPQDGIVENDTLDIVRDDGRSSKIARGVIRSHADQLFRLIAQGDNISDDSPEIVRLKTLLQTEKLTAKSIDKSDLQGEVISSNQTHSHTLGFSVKSHVGSNPSLINSNHENSLLYYRVVPTDHERLTDKDRGLLEQIANDFNLPNDGKRTQIRSYLEILKKNGFRLKFEKTAKEALGYTLRIIDTKFPDILAEVLLEHYTYEKKSKKGDRRTLGELVDMCCTRRNLSPIFQMLGQNSEEIINSARYKMQNFLLAFSTGASVSAKWDGHDQANGGIIIVLKDGRVVCLELFTRNSIGEYLLSNTVFDTPSLGRHGGGQLEKIGGDWFFGLQLQVRFDQR